MSAKAHLLTGDYVCFSLEIKLAADVHQAPSITIVFSCPMVLRYSDNIHFIGNIQNMQ